MTNKNIQMKKREGNSWDNLYPVTLFNNVYNSKGVDLETEFLNLHVNVKNFNAVGDGVTDDTEAINNAIQYASDNDINVVYIPKGVYMIKADDGEKIPWGSKGGIALLSNITLKLDDNAILKALPSSTEGYNIIRVRRDSNIKIIGGTIEGDREEHVGETGEWGHGINLKGAENIYISTTIKDCWGDGIYVGGDAIPSKNIIVEKTVATNNRRQGISLVHGENIHLINSDFSDTNGTLPHSGIDIEPANTSEWVKHVKVLNCSFNNNEGTGFLIDGNLGEVSDIYVDGITANGNYRGIRVRGQYAVKDIFIHNSTAKENNLGYELTNNCQNVVFKNAHADENTRGFAIDVIPNVRIYDSVIAGLEIKAGTTDLHIENSDLIPLASESTAYYIPSIERATFKNVRFLGNNNTNGIRFLDASYLTLENCYIYNLGNYAIYGVVSDSLIKGNRIIDVGSSTAAALIELTGYSSRNTIIDNSSRRIDKTDRPTNGVKLSTNSTANWINNNDFFTVPTGGFFSGNTEENRVETNR